MKKGWNVDDLRKKLKENSGKIKYLDSWIKKENKVDKDYQGISDWEMEDKIQRGLYYIEGGSIYDRGEKRRKKVENRIQEGIGKEETGAWMETEELELFAEIYQIQFKVRSRDGTGLRKTKYGKENTIDIGEIFFTGNHFEDIENIKEEEWEKREKERQEEEEKRE